MLGFAFGAGLPRRFAPRNDGLVVRHYPT